MRNPYITGAYVTGRKYYGRAELIDYLLHGEAHACWLVGNRRIGKTSLLRQLEMLAVKSKTQIPLYWDMQGSDTASRLGQYLADAINESHDRFSGLRLLPSTLAEGDAAVLLAGLRRAAARVGREVLLLCDETEVLVRIARAEPEPMQRLHREMTAGSGLRVVATSTQTIYELHDACKDWPTSPFLAGFDLAQTLGSLTPHSAHALITQVQSEEPVTAAPEVIEAISEHTNNHPYLIQLLCSRLFQEDGSLRALNPDDLHVDPALRGFFSIDYNALTQADRGILWAVLHAQMIEEGALAQSLGSDPGELHRRVHNLERLGYLRRIYDQVAIGNEFLANWLAADPAASAGVVPAQPVAHMSEAALESALTRREVQETSYLCARLNAYRTRLVELEATRARDLLGVSPQVLVEVEQVQREIKHLRRLLDEVSAA